MYEKVATLRRPCTVKSEKTRDLLNILPTAGRSTRIFFIPLSRMMRCFALLSSLVLLFSSLQAEEGRAFPVVPADSLSAAADTLSAPAAFPADSLGVDSLRVDTAAIDSTYIVVGDTVRNNRYDYRSKKGITRAYYWLMDYLSNTNKESNKKVDWSFIAGPGYNPNTSFAIGGAASILYRWDRNDVSLQKSDCSIFFNLGVTGMVEVGFQGHNYMPRDRHRWFYELSFKNVPNDMWGIGFDMGKDDANKGKYKQYQLIFSPDYLFRLANNLYMGARMKLAMVNTRDFTFPVRDGQVIDLINGQDRNIFSTGLGATFLYDSRDYGLNAYHGHYVCLQQLYYAPGLNTYDFWSTDFTYRTYTPTWTKCVLAFEFHGLFNYGGEVPWTNMAEAGVDGRMRGYYRGRYRDNNIIEAQLEFRQRIWHRWGAVLWGGFGNVFPNFDGFRWNHTLPSYGLGIRWEFKPRVNVRIDYGFTRDEGSVVFNLNEAF